jgi:uncharacterized protein YndB with AHSA1/START domain
MEDRKVTHATYVLERSYRAAPERVFTAFSDPARKRGWFVGERKLAVEEFQMDFRVGGHETARYRFLEGSPFPGAALVNQTVYQDIVPNSRIVFAYTMSMGEKPFSASLVTLEMTPAQGGGTNFLFTEQGAFFENSDGPKIREEGWTSLLARLERELER